MSAVCDTGAAGATSAHTTGGGGGGGGAKDDTSALPAADNAYAVNAAVKSSAPADEEKKGADTIQRRGENGKDNNKQQEKEKKEDERRRRQQEGDGENDKELLLTKRQRVLPPGSVAALRRRVAELAELAARADRDVDELLMTPGSSGADPLASSNSAEKERLLTEEERTFVRDASRRKLAEVIAKQCANVVRTISNHKWAWPFNEPVDPVKLNIPDYDTIITNPMDLGTVRSRIEATALANANKPRSDAAGVMNAAQVLYKHPDEVLHDVRLVFQNAIKFNSPGSDVYVMAQTLWDKFEERWRVLVLPRLEEARVQRQQQVTQFVEQSEKRNRSEKVMGVAKELKECEAVMLKTRKAGDDLRVLMAMMTSQAEAVRGQNGAVIEITKDDIREIRSALDELGSVASVAPTRNGDGSGAEEKHDEAEKKKKKKLLHTVVTILEEESDERMPRISLPCDVPADGGPGGNAPAPANAGTQPQAPPAAGATNVAVGGMTSALTSAPSVAVGTAAPAAAAATATTTTAAATTAAATATANPPIPPPVPTATRLSLTVDLDMLDTLALRRLQRALKLGPYARDPPSANDTTDAAAAPVYMSRAERSHRRADRRNKLQHTDEDADIEII